MGFHHVALATRDTAATHAFYTDVMGFELVKVVAGPTPTGGWSKHFFYSTGTSPNGENGMMAFWELHDDTVPADFPANINEAAGLPWWVNHVAFDAPTMADLERRRDRWRAHGETVLQVDHEFCVSVYIRDPSGNLVEFCHTVREFTAEERSRALELVTAANPELDYRQPPVTVHKPLHPADA